MKNYFRYLSMLFMAMVLLSACEEEDDNGGVSPPADLEEASSFLEGTYTVVDVREGSGIYPDGLGDWSNFEITFSNVTTEGGSYTATGSAEGFEHVWGNQANFTFDQESAAIRLIRDDQAVIRASQFTDSDNIRLSFFDRPSPIVEGFDESWSFDLDKQ